MPYLFFIPKYVPNYIIKSEISDRFNYIIKVFIRGSEPETRALFN